MSDAPAPEPDAPHVALVIGTRDRAARLPAFLDAIGRMRPRAPWELVLVDNGSRDATPRVLADFAAAASCPVRIVSEPRPGLARAQNAGILASRAPLLVFIDDDCYPAPDFLDRWIEAFADAELGYATGRIELFDPADAPISIRTDARPQPIPADRVITPGLVQGANLAFRREVLLALGGFDPALGPGATFNFADLDIASRAAMAGFAGGYFPAPLVHHHHRRRERAEVARLLRSYAHGRGAYYASLLLRGRDWRAVLRAWYASLRHMGARSLPRELAGAAHFMLHWMTRRVRRS